MGTMADNQHWAFVASVYIFSIADCERWDSNISLHLLAF